MIRKYIIYMTYSAAILGLFASPTIVIAQEQTMTRGHLHHRLLAMGMNQKQAVLLMYAITAVLGIAAVLWAEFDGFYAALIIAVIITAVAVGAKKIGILNDR